MTKAHSILERLMNHSDIAQPGPQPTPQPETEPTISPEIEPTIPPDSTIPNII